MTQVNLGSVHLLLKASSSVEMVAVPKAQLILFGIQTKAVVENEVPFNQHILLPLAGKPKQPAYPPPAHLLQFADAAARRRRSRAPLPRRRRVNVDALWRMYEDDAFFSRIRIRINEDAELEPHEGSRSRSRSRRRP